jgi:hypothetical protein
MTSDPSLIAVGDLAELVTEAYELLSGLVTASDVSEDDMRKWLASCANLIDSLKGNRQALYARVCEALGQASMCWEPRPEGEFRSDLARQAADRLMPYIDAYANALPLIRPATLISLDDYPPEEQLAAAIYEISARISSGLDEKWSAAPANIKEILTQTAAELIDSGLITTLPDPHPPVNDTVASFTAEEHEALQDAVARTLDADLSDIVMNSFHLIGCNRPDEHDGRIEGACEQNGHRIHVTPPNIPMPPGFGKKEDTAH